MIIKHHILFPVFFKEQMYKNYINNYLLVLASVVLLGTSCSRKNKTLINENETIPILSKVKNKDCPKLILCIGQVPEETVLFGRKNDIENAVLITGNSIHHKDQLRFNKEKLHAKIERMLPKRSAKAVGVLNWEGHGIEVLRKANTNSKEFNDVLREYLKAIEYAKEMRPNVKWGFYALPLRSYWNRDEQWKERSKALKPIYQKSDILFPSIYDFYEDEVSFAGPTKDSLYVVDNIRLALEEGHRYNCEVMPFVWHRYHNSNKKKGRQLIPEQEFKKHIHSALTAKNNDEGISAIIWWGADAYTLKKKNTVLLKEAEQSKNLLKYQNDISMNYSKYINDVLISFCDK